MTHDHRSAKWGSRCRVPDEPIPENLQLHPDGYYYDPENPGPPHYRSCPVKALCPGEPATSLVPLETNQRIEPELTALHRSYLEDPNRAFIHTGWRNRRRKILRALIEAGIGPNRTSAFRACGACAWVERSVEPEPRYRIKANWCRDRWCAVCATRRGREIAARVLTDRDPRNLRFVTLTLRIAPRGQASPGEPGSLKHALDRLYKSFTKLRATPLWKNATTGGAAFTELKWSPSSQGWNVHVHAIIEGRYMPHPAIKGAWHKITGDSHVVDIRKVRTTTAAVAYVTRYVSKSWDRKTEQQPTLLSEAIQTLSARHLVTTFGTWRGKPLRAVPSDTEWELVMPLEALQDRMEAGEPSAYIIWASLHLKHGMISLVDAAHDAYQDP